MGGEIYIEKKGGGERKNARILKAELLNDTRSWNGWKRKVSRFDTITERSVMSKTDRRIERDRNFDATR